MGPPMDDRKDVTVPMPGAWADAIDDQLEYGDSRSGWIREAIEEKFEREGIAAEEEESEGNGIQGETAAGIS